MRRCLHGRRVFRGILCGGQVYSVSNGHENKMENIAFVFLVYCLQYGCFSFSVQGVRFKATGTRRKCVLTTPISHMKSSGMTIANLF